MRSKVPVAAAMILPAALLAACGQQSHVTSTKTSAGGTAVIALAVQTSPNWWFPVIPGEDYGDSNFQMNVMMYTPLIDITKTDGVNYGQSLAQSVHSNPQGTKFVVHLNRKWHWSNGRPVTSQDVVFTWDIMKYSSSNLPGAPWVYGGQGTGGVPTDWQSVTAQGPYTVAITLKTPTNPNWFIHNGLAQIIPVPRAIWDKYPSNPIQELKFIQSVANSPTNSVYRTVDGPYRFQSMQANNYWNFVPNPRYDGHKSTLSKVTYQYETSSESEFLGLEQGTINVGYLPAADWGARQKLKTNILSPSYIFGFSFLQPNYSNQAPGKLGPVFRKLYVRQAMEMGINQASMIQSFFHGNGVKEADPVPPKPHTVFSNGIQPAYGFNPSAGKKLLEAHGWRDVGGVMTKNGVKLSFTLLYMSGDQLDSNIVQLVKSDWAEEGIQVQLQSAPFDQVLTTAQQNEAPKWNMAFWGTQSWTYEPDYYPTGESFYLTDAGANQGGYSNPTMDALIKASEGPGTTAQATARLDAYLAFSAKNLPVLFLPYNPVYNVYAKNLKGVTQTWNPITTFYYPNFWSIAK